MHKIMKRILAALCAAAICGALVTLSAANQDQQTAEEMIHDVPEHAGEQYAYIADRSVYFYDVGEGYRWAYHAIDYLATLNVARGTDQYLFEPERSITRADFALLLYRAYDMTGYASGQYFADVKPEDYYADAVLATRNLGIAKGEDGYFYPKKSLTRQDAAVMLERTLEAAGIQLTQGSLAGYSDAASVKFYAQEAVGKLTQAGIIGGASGKVRPTDTISRAEMAVMLYRALVIEQQDGAWQYVDHPERVDLCIGDKIYSGATIANYDAAKTYGGLMAYTSFEQTEDGHAITLGDTCDMNQQIQYENGVLTVDGQEVEQAEDCIGVRVEPYSQLKEIVSTEKEYAGGRASYDEAGRVNIIYYNK